MNKIRLHGVVITLCILSASITSQAHLSTQKWIGLSGIGSLAGGALGAAAFGLYHYNCTKNGDYLTGKQKAIGYVGSIVTGGAIGGVATALGSYKFTTAQQVSRLKKNLNTINEVVILAQNDDLITNDNHETAINKAHGHEQFKYARAVDSLGQKGELLHYEIEMLRRIHAEIKATKEQDGYISEYAMLLQKTIDLITESEKLYKKISDRIAYIQQKNGYKKEYSDYKNECSRIKKERLEKELADAKINKMNADAYYARKKGNAEEMHGKAEEMRGKAETINAWHNVAKTVFGIPNQKVDITMRHN